MGFSAAKPYIMLPLKDLHNYDLSILKRNMYDN